MNERKEASVKTPEVTCGYKVAACVQVREMFVCYLAITPAPGKTSTQRVPDLLQSYLCWRRQINDKMNKQGGRSG